MYTSIKSIRFLSFLSPDPTQHHLLTYLLAQLNQEKTLSPILLATPGNRLISTIPTTSVVACIEASVEAAGLFASATFFSARKVYSHAFLENSNLSTPRQAYRPIHQHTSNSFFLDARLVRLDKEGKEERRHTHRPNSATEANITKSTTIPTLPPESQTKNPARLIPPFRNSMRAMNEAKIHAARSRLRRPLIGGVGGGGEDLSFIEGLFVTFCHYRH